MSAAPIEPGSPTPLPGGITLPPLPEELTETAVAAPSTSPVQPAPGGLRLWLLPLLAGLLAGTAAAAGLTATLLKTAFAPWQESQQLMLERMERSETSLRELGAQLDVLRTQQLEQTRQMQEVRQVVATITIQTSSQLKEAQQQAQQARQQLETLKVEAALNNLNLLFDQARLPLVITEARMRETVVELKLSYWGFRNTEREALQMLSRFTSQLQEVFPGRRMPADFIVTFHNAQNNREAVYRRGLWDPSDGGGGGS